MLTNDRFGRPAVLALFFCLLTVAASARMQEQPAATPPAGDAAEATPTLAVTDMVLARAIDREAKAPVDTATVFPADVGQIYCFTRVAGAQSPTSITHVWYREGESMARVELAVGSASWRTYSSKKLLPAWTGRWEVKVLDESGAVLATAAFTVQPESAEPE